LAAYLPNPNTICTISKGYDMKRLILMRHAKSDWSGEALVDHDRSLNARGRTNAADLGDWMRAHDVLPDEVFSSSATRTAETYARLKLPQGIKPTFTKKLYLASLDQILTILHRATGRTVLVLGHNPGIGMCAHDIIAAPPDHPQFIGFPTGATLVADFDIDKWSDLRWGTGRVAHFVVPRGL
jgi:phosphohistidine phosphatase